MLKCNASVLKLVPLVFLNLNKSSSPIAKPLDSKEFEYHHKQERGLRLPSVLFYGLTDFNYI